jgi:predicted ATPase
MATTLAYSRSDVEKVSRLMKRVTGVGFRTDTVPPQSAKPVSESQAGVFSLVAEGFGTNTLVQLLFEMVRAVPGATVLIEEPEVHLHPKAQADLASVLVEEAKADNKQVIMTTHSEHVAGRLLTLVAEGKLSPEEVAIYSFEKDEDGVCSAQEIEVTEHGQVVGGLKSFFETDLDEMRRFVDALRARA